MSKMDLKASGPVGCNLREAMKGKPKDISVSCLLNDALSSSEYTGSSDRMISE
jgi:hypothetical protein